MSNQVLSTVGAIVKSINPTLITALNQSIEQITGSDDNICYLGPNGEDDHASVTYCNELCDAHRAMVGSWYLTPERHVVEYIIFVMLSLMIIRMILPTMSQYSTTATTTTKNNNKMKPPLFMQIITAILFTCQLNYKYHGYSGKILFMGMPCNVLLTMWTILCFVPLKEQTMHIMHQLIVPHTSLAVVAVATPDTSDLLMYMEVPFFFIFHTILILYPLYFLKSGRISVLSLPNCNDGIVVNFVKWWILACAYFALFYFGIATPLSLIYGLNINYMLSPPPNPGDLVSGEHFRLQSTLCCAAAFFLVRFAATAMEVFAKVMLSSEKSPTSKKSN